MLLIHGLTASAAGLDLLSAYLAAHRYRTMAIDLPGHVLGAGRDELTSVAQAVASLRTAMHTLAAPQVAVVGHSFGGACSYLVSGDPGVAGLGVVAVGALGRRQFTGPVGTRMRDSRQAYVRGRPIDDLLADMHESLKNAPPPPASIPVLAVGAENDAIVSRADMELWLERVPHAGLQWVKGSHMDAPVAARAVIGRWLDEVVSV